MVMKYTKKKFGLGGSVILNFLDTLVHAYPQRISVCILTTFFTSLKLLDAIRQRGHGATGTRRCNRLENCPIADPKQFKKEGRDTEKHFCNKSSETLAVPWNDNSVVCIASIQRGMIPFKK